MAKIHPSAVIENGAEIAVDVEIGPFCHVGPHVELCAGVVLESHVVIGGHTKIGDNTHIYPFACLGQPPQDLKFRGEKSRLEVGKNNRIREYVTMNPGTEGGGMVTRVGDNCLFMSNAHVAHDCIVGNNVIMAVSATLAGHVEIGDFAVLGGLCAVHQFVKIGHHAMIGGMSGIENDVIPYGNAFGERAFLNGLNLVGLKRSGFEKDQINALRNAFKTIFTGEGNLSERVERAKSEYSSSGPVMEIIDFITADSARALCQPKNSKLRIET